MTRRIFIQCDNIDEQDRESQEYLDHKYWDQPTRLKPMPGDDAWWPGMGTIAPTDKAARIARIIEIRPR